MVDDDLLLLVEDDPLHLEVPVQLVSLGAERVLAAGPGVPARPTSDFFCLKYKRDSTNFFY